MKIKDEGKVQTNFVRFVSYSINAQPLKYLSSFLVPAKCSL